MVLNLVMCLLFNDKYQAIATHRSSPQISSNKGTARVYYSSSYQPNPARFEGTSTVTPSNPNLIYSDKKNETIFITVEALTDASITFSFGKSNV